MKSILDPTFRYYSAADTDLHRTFRRVRRQMLEHRGEQATADQQARQLQYIGIELNPESVAITHQRQSHTTLSLPLKAAA